MFCGDWVHTDIVGKTCEHSGEESLSECEDEGGWTAVEVQRCSRAVSGGDLLRSVRLGPFFSVPGQWRSLMTHSLRGLLNDGDRVVSFVGAPVTEAGTRIGFPPLHVHHVHVRKPERSGAMQPPVGRERASHWFETHGDYSRGDDFGVGARSAAGYATRLPEGHCYVVTSAEQIDLNAEVNDVRVDASGASELSYYLEAAFTLAPDADCKPVSKFWLRRPRSRELPTDVWERYAAPSTDSVTWWSGKMPSSGRLLHAWLHTHRSRFGGLLLLAAGPEVVNCAALGITPADGVDVAPVRNASFARAALAAAARVVCEDDASQPNSVSLRGHGSEGVADGDYDRRGGLSCRDWSFGVGDAWTVVAFSAARFLPHLRVTPQHTELWMFVDLPGVPNSTATSSPDAPDSPFFTDEANVCWAETRLAAPFSRRSAASLALAALLVLVALASSPRHSFLPWAWRTRGQYLRLPCDSGVS